MRPVALCFTFPLTTPDALNAPDPLFRFASFAFFFAKAKDEEDDDRAPELLSLKSSLAADMFNLSEDFGLADDFGLLGFGVIVDVGLVGLMAGLPNAKAEGGDQTDLSSTSSCSSSLTLFLNFLGVVSRRDFAFTVSGVTRPTTDGGENPSPVPPEEALSAEYDTRRVATGESYIEGALVSGYSSA